MVAEEMMPFWDRIIFLSNFLQPPHLNLLTMAEHKKAEILSLRIHTGKKHPKFELQCLLKMLIWTFGSSVH